MGASINNDNGMMYITSNNIPWIGKIHKEKNNIVIINTTVHLKDYSMKMVTQDLNLLGVI